MQKCESKSADQIPSTWIFLTLLPVLLAAWGRFGLKVPAAFVLNLGTALFIDVFSKKNENAAFPWGLFCTFSLFVPLGMPLWLVPVALMAGWIIAVSCFGGYGKNVFNPVALALVLLIAGYGSSVSLEASKPFPGAFDAFSVMSAGMNTASNESVLSLKRPADFPGVLFRGGRFASLPGLAFPGPLLLIALVSGLLFSGRRVWTLLSPVFVYLFTLLISKSGFNLNFDVFAVLFTGVLPGLMLVGLADMASIPASYTGQAMHALIFAILSTLFICFAPLMIYGIYALLLTQVLYPLCACLFQWSAEND